MDQPAAVTAFPLLKEQLRFYDAWACEYDDWWGRRNRYDLGDKLNRK